VNKRGTLVSSLLHREYARLQEEKQKMFEKAAKRKMQQTKAKKELQENLWILLKKKIKP